MGRTDQPSSPSRLRPARRAAAVFAAWTAAVPAAHAQQAEAARAYTIPPGPLTEALNRFGREAGIMLSFSTDLTGGLASPGLGGRFTVPQALERLLSGTGLAAERQANGGYTLRRVPELSAPRTLAPVRVTASAEPPADALPAPYAGGQVARGGRAGLLGNRDFMDSPFSMTSYTAEVIQDQQARSVGDVVKNDPSVRTIWPDGSYISQFTIRGFPTQTQDMAVNGLYGIVPPQMTGGLEFFERVEILKGPGALLGGMAPTGGIGGSINLVTKRATDTPITRVTASYYSDAQFGGHLDLGRRFGEDKRWGIRVNGAYRDGRTGVDQQSQQAGAAAIGIDYRGDRVRLSADFGYHHMRTDVPTRIVYTDNANFQIPAAPKNTLNLGQDWYFAKSDDRFGMVRGEFDLAPDWTAYAAAGARSNDFLGLYNFIYLQNAQGDFRANQYYQPTYSDTRTGQAGLRGRFATGAVRHELNLAVDALHTESGVLAPVVATYTSNLYRPAPVAQPDLSAYGSSAPKTSVSDLTSVALADTASFLDDRVQLTVGVRKQNVKAQNFAAATGARSGPGYNEDRLSPGAGLVLRPWRDTSFYANYIEGLSQGPTAPAGSANQGFMFAPIRSKQYEVGAKHDFGRFAATLAAFQISQPSGATDPATQLFGVDGEQRNRGIELNVFGEPLHGVRLLGGAALMDGVLTKTAGGTYDGNKAIGVPATQLNLAGEWDAAFLPGLTLTGRVIYTSSQYYNVANSQSIPSWTRVDLGLRYRTRMAGRAAVLRAGVENVFDRDYWAAASSSFGLARGAPRTFLVSMTLDF
ncbi:TonB-dependent receptor [Pigmentiphaga soli]|uniref:TonB-dependent receptor n=1 Tax=Pigmentiphaga soli TaxID=1007095 RepID=A0ABP8GKW2_9BURK